MMPMRSVAMRVSVADVEIVNCLGAVAICVRDYQVRRRGQLADRWALWRALPTVNLTHVDLTGDEQRPEEQYRCCIGRRQHSLRLNPPLEVFVQTLDRVRCHRATPLARQEAHEGEETITGFLQTSRQSATGRWRKSPLAVESLVAGSDVLGRGR